MGHEGAVRELFDSGVDVDEVGRLVTVTVTVMDSW